MLFWLQKDIKERQKAQQAVKSCVREKRIQSARSRQYYDEYQIRMRSRMLKKRTREEQVCITVLQSPTSSQLSLTDTINLVNFFTKKVEIARFNISYHNQSLMGWGPVIFQIFKRLFQEGLSIQKERIRELRKYAREQRETRAEKQHQELSSLEN